MRAQLPLSVGRVHALLPPTFCSSEGCNLFDLLPAAPFLQEECMMSHPPAGRVHAIPLNLC